MALGITSSQNMTVASSSNAAAQPQHCIIKSQPSLHPPAVSQQQPQQPAPIVQVTSQLIGQPMVLQPSTTNVVVPLIVPQIQPKHAVVIATSSSTMDGLTTTAVTPYTGGALNLIQGQLGNGLARNDASGDGIQPQDPDVDPQELAELMR